MTHLPEGETQFVVELPAYLRPLIEAHQTEAITSLGMALGLLFGLPHASPVRVSCHFTDRFQLLEVVGVVYREATPDEITGCFIGVQATLTNLLFAERAAIPIPRRRVTDA